MNIKIPKEWRQGQFIYNFLEWLTIKKGYQSDGRQADAFHIQDEDFDKLVEEFLNIYK